MVLLFGENGLAAPQKCKHGVIMRSIHSVPRHENMCLHNHVNVNTHSSLVHNSKVQKQAMLFAVRGE
jgi:hypothetical protein